MPPRRRTRSARIESADDVVVVDSVVVDDDEPPNTRRRRTEPGGTCCFPACNLPVGGGVSANSAYPTFTDEDAKCCDRCHKVVLADRLACTHPGFPQRECIHPKDPGHACSFTNKPENMEKWKEWAAFNSGCCDAGPEIERATGVSELIGKAQCLRCAGAFLERCNVLKHLNVNEPIPYAETTGFMVGAVLTMIQPFHHPNISPEGRTAIVRTLFREWWDSPRIQLSSAYKSHSDLLTTALYHSVLPPNTRERDENVLCVLKTLSEENIQWWSPRLFVDRDAGFYIETFKLMIEDMNRTLALLSGSDAENVRSSYVKDIAGILTPWLVDGDHLELQVFIESEGIKLGGKSVLGDVADEIDLPKLIRDVHPSMMRAGETSVNAEEAIALNRNIKWFASLYHHTRGTGRLKWTRSCWETQKALFECRGDATDELILDAMELTMMHFRPFSVNPCVFGMAILQAIREDQQFGFGNKLVRLFLNHAEARFWCTWPSTQNEVKEYFGDNISHVFVELFSDQTTPHKEFFSLMSHVFVNACLADRDDGDSDWRADCGLFHLYRMLNLRPSDFAPEVREHENFWLKDDTSEADKKTALHLAQSSIDKYKERISDGVYKEIMDDLMAEWRG